MRILLATTLFAALCAAETPAYDARFDLRLFARLAAAPGNIACSPFSARVALAMTYGGARGPTAREMAQVLGMGEGGHADLAELLPRLAVRNDREEVSFANALWTKGGDPFLPAYLDLVKRHYGAEPKSLDFGAEPEAAARRINAWVAERTHDRIPTIVSPDLFNPNTSLVLTNAVYFRAAWRRAFNVRMTRSLPFTLASGERVEVPTMRQADTFRYAERGGARAVELPYSGDRFSMVLILSDGELDADGFRALVESLKPEPVDVMLPRFTFESAFRLDDALKAMGMPTAFGGDADFSGINGRKDLFIAAVLHRAFVAVDEYGTEAAAATAVLMERKGRAPEARVFHADRPFRFCIRDRETGTVLFLGRVADPRF